MAGIVAYFRVSTKQQGESGLGLEDQASSVEAFAKQSGKTIVARYMEVETGKRADRPELAKALAHTRRARATLVVAKLDRLARNARFLLSIVESGADVIFCDYPTIPPGPTGKFILTQMASVAELEAGLIAQRTKAALAAAKARGTLLGSARPGHWDGKEDIRAAALVKARAAAGKSITEKAREAYTDLKPVMAEMRGKGLSLQAIADELNTQSHTTRRGCAWGPVQVSRVLGRA